MAEANPRAPAIGIDLGTTNSCVAVYQDGKVKVLSNDNKKNITPSVIAFTPDGTLYGDAAKDYSRYCPDECVENIKRIIGRDVKDRTVQEYNKYASVPAINHDGKLHIQVNDKNGKKFLRPEEISSMILKHMKGIAERHLGVPVKDAVITVPAYFTESQRRATMDAGRIAGLRVVQILNEPTAAALAYGFDNEEEDRRKLLVYDLGGGTFDVSIMTVDDGEFDVISMDGDNNLGGVDIDNRMVRTLVRDFQREKGVDINQDRLAMRRLRSACEKAKIELATNFNTKIDIQNIINEMDLTYNLKRVWLEDICDEILEKTRSIVEAALAHTDIDKSTVTDVILVGGSTRMPMVRDLMKELFSGQDPQVDINPEEAIAYGAAIQAAIKTGTKVRNIRLREVIPMTLGFAARGGIMKALIKRNRRLPAEENITVTTGLDNQDRITMQIYEGERQLVKDNCMLGVLTLAGIPPTPRGVPQIKINFRVDNDGILHASAYDPATERMEKLRLSNRSNLSPESLRKAIQKSAEMDEKDRLQVRKIKAKNRLEFYLGKIDETVKNSKLQEKIGAEKLSMLRKVMDDTNAIVHKQPSALSYVNYENAQNELEELWKPIAISLYNEPGPPGDDTYRPSFVFENSAASLMTVDMSDSQWTDLAGEAVSDA